MKSSSSLCIDIRAMVVPVFPHILKSLVDDSYSILDMVAKDTSANLSDVESWDSKSKIEFISSSEKVSVVSGTTLSQFIRSISGHVVGRSVERIARWLLTECSCTNSGERLKAVMSS